MNARLIVGGTFNPVHQGHLAMASGAREALGVERVDWVPCHTPHHRSDDELLPFDFRVQLVRAAIAGERHMQVSEIEAGLPKPSLTWRTIAALHAAEPEAELHFVLGPREFLRLHTWVRGREIAAAANMVIVPRGAMDIATFGKALAAAWPEARAIDPAAGWLAGWEILPGRKAVLPDLPVVDVSATMIRDRWRAGAGMAGLMPDAVLDLMSANTTLIEGIWGAQGGRPGGNGE